MRHAGVCGGECVCVCVCVCGVFARLSVTGGGGDDGGGDCLRCVDEEASLGGGCGDGAGLRRGHHAREPIRTSQHRQR